MAKKKQYRRKTSSRPVRGMNRTPRYVTKTESLKRSNAQHARLRWSAHQKGDKVRYEYHDEILRYQQSRRELMDGDDKRALWNHCLLIADLL